MESLFPRFEHEWYDFTKKKSVMLWVFILKGVFKRDFHNMNRSSSIAFYEHLVNNKVEL